LSLTIVEVVLRQLLVDGIFHADLHGGNILLTPDNGLVLLDFGSVGRLDRPARQAMRSLLLAVDRQDGAAATTALRHLLVVPSELFLATKDSRIRSLVMSIESMLADELFNELSRPVVDLRFKVSPASAAASRCLGVLEGTLKLLDPECD